MKLGIIGLPNVGKSTLFNAITQAGAESANYPFCTIEPNIGVVPVPDKRLKKLAKFYSSDGIVPSSIEVYDIAGLVEGASKGEGLGNKFLSNIREVQAIIHVVRCFEDENVVHVEGSIDPIRDIETVEIELILSDIELLERRLERVERTVKHDKGLEAELDLIKKALETLEEGKSLRSLNLSSEESILLESFDLLSTKPVIYAVNISEDDLVASDNNCSEMVKDHARKNGSEVVLVSAEIEEEISGLDEEEKLEFIEALNLDKSGLEKLIEASYKLLGLMSFLTANPKEASAWAIKEGTTALEAAGKIHSDIERGFIKAEVIAFEELLALGGDIVEAKKKGLVRIEGRDYIVKEGDLILFRFNV